MDLKKVDEVVEEILPETKLFTICTWLTLKESDIWIDGFNTCLDHAKLLLKAAIISGKLTVNEGEK